LRDTCLEPLSCPCPCLRDDTGDPIAEMIDDVGEPASAAASARAIRTRSSRCVCKSVCVCVCVRV
jgi:hypothetical protein